MIQDYLKTSLVFYDDINKQHRHNDCCQETTRFDGLISPTDRFLPFQIRIPTDEWVGDLNTATLYDDTDTAVANLIAAYGIRSRMKVVSNCSWLDTFVWVIYNGGVLTAGLPEGFHYIRITDDAGHAWYSEIFQICDMVDVDFWGLEILTGWANGTVALGDFETLTTDGREILEATETAGDGSCYSNPFDGCVGDTFHYSIYFSRTSGTEDWAIRLTAAGDETNILANVLNLTSGNGWYNGTFTVTADGPYQLVFFVGADPPNTETAYLLPSLKKIIPGTYDGCIGLEWYNDCDFDGIIYQTKDTWYTRLCEYTNRLYFQKHLESPRTETTRDEAERLGTRFVRSIVQKKYYMFKVYVPEFLYNVLQSVALYANPVRSGVTIYLDNGDVGYIEELNIASEEWTEGNCYCHLTIEFREDAVVWTNCCDNYALRDESSCS